MADFPAPSQGQLFDGKVPDAGVDIRRQDGHAHIAGIVDVERHLLGLVLGDREQGGHVFHRVMQFQEAGLDGQQAVIGGVGFVEAIAGKLVPIVVDGLGGGALHPFCNGSLHELMALLFNLFVLFLGNGGAQFIRFGRRVPGQLDGSPHQLFLVEGDAIGIAENRLQGRMAVLDFRFAVHAADVIGDEVHRSGTVERHHGDDVVQAVGFICTSHLVIPEPSNWKTPRVLPSPEELVRLRVIGGDVVQLVLDAVTLLDGRRHAP